MLSSSAACFPLPAAAPPPAVILSGANISSTYLSTRQDRYLVLHSRQLAQYLTRAVSAVSRFSYQLRPATTATAAEGGPMIGGGGPERQRLLPRLPWQRRRAPLGSHPHLQLQPLLWPGCSLLPQQRHILVTAHVDHGVPAPRQPVPHAQGPGLRTGRRMSHVFRFEAPMYPKPLYITDAALNIAPTLADKADIVQNAILFAHIMGVAQPKVAILAAVETVNPSMPSTLDAAALCKMADRGQITGGVIDGPFFERGTNAHVDHYLLNLGDLMNVGVLVFCFKGRHHFADVFFVKSGFHLVAPRMLPWL